MPIIDSTAAIASLYQAPLGAFVAERDALSRELQTSGHRDVAARVRAAAKPTRTAWLINQAYWRHREAYDALLESGEAARAAQQARLFGDEGSDLIEILGRRDAQVRVMLDRAAAIARADGMPMTAALKAQVRASLEAIAAHGPEARLAHGQLTTEVGLPGLAALSGMVLPAAAADPSTRRLELVSSRGDLEAQGTGRREPPDPRCVEAEAALARARQHETELGERLHEVTRGEAAAAAVLASADAALAEATREAEVARAHRERAEATRAAVSQDLERAAAVRAEAEAALAALQPRPVPAPTPARSSRHPRPRRPRS